MAECIDTRVKPFHLVETCVAMQSIKITRLIWESAGNSVARKATVNRDGECCSWGSKQVPTPKGSTLACSGDGPLAPLLMGPLKDFKWGDDEIICILGRLPWKHDRY